MSFYLSTITWHIGQDQDRFNVFVDDHLITTAATRKAAELALVEYVQDLIDQGLLFSELELAHDRSLTEAVHE